MSVVVKKEPHERQLLRSIVYQCIILYIIHWYSIIPGYFILPLYDIIAVYNMRVYMKCDIQAQLVDKTKLGRKEKVKQNI